MRRRQIWVAHLMEVIVVVLGFVLLLTDKQDRPWFIPLDIAIICFGCAGFSFSAYTNHLQWRRLAAQQSSKP